MNNRVLRMQQVLALALALAMIVPVATYAADGKKHFKEGLKYEENRQWDKAAEKFALAVAEKPSNIEYQLHLQRSLVNAGVMLVERGDRMAEQKDYNAAYQAYRQAFAFDPTNELSLIKMRRMLELQGLPTDSLPRSGDPAGPSYKEGGSNVKAGYSGATNGAVSPSVMPKRVLQVGIIPTRRLPKTEVIARSDNLLSVIEHLAQVMRLNVVFDQQVEALRSKRINIELRDVTHAKALEIILKTNNLMYTQLDTRTIVVAMDNPQSRMRYEQLAVRTFYVKNAEVNDVRTAITTALGTKTVVPSKQLNALIVRDTPANLELIESMIDSLDKSKAEVLIDVNMYEVSRNDLLQIGNQFRATGDDKNPLALNFLGGIDQQGVRSFGPRALIGPLGFALGLPSSAVSFFQDRGKAKLLASTQVHVLDTEQHTIRIGQRVPIQTATLPSFNIPSDRDRRRAENQTGVDANELTLGLGGAFGTGIPQIQYENVGLNIDMTPSVFEDEVQMKMKIESTSVDASTGKLTPTFNQRTMSSVARIKDGQTTLVAGVSQNTEAKNVKGLPLIGLIPILGRFFSTPETIDRQSDVVITVTPHILRRADIREDDHLARYAGTQSDPTTQLTIEQILYLAEMEEAQQSQVAAANPAPPSAAPQNKPVVRAPEPGTVLTRPESPGVVVMAPPTTTAPATQNFRQTSAQPAQPKVEPTNNQHEEVLDDDDDDDEEAQDGQVHSPISLTVRSAMAVAPRGQDLYVAVIVNGNAEITASNISLIYDANILDVKGVRDGGLLRAGGANPELQFTAEGGMLNVQLERPAGSGGVPARGQLLIVIFNVKGQGRTTLSLNEQQTMLRSPSGLVLPIKVQATEIETR